MSKEAKWARAARRLKETGNCGHRHKTLRAARMCLVRVMRHYPKHKPGDLYINRCTFLRVPGERIAYQVERESDKGQSETGD